MKQERKETLLRQVRSRRARRLGISEDRLSELDEATEPRFIRSAKARAERLGTTYQEVIRQDRERLRASVYPGPECLDPEEVEALCDGEELEDERLSHVSACTGCQELIEALGPNDALADEFVAEALSAASPLREEQEVFDKAQAVAATGWLRSRLPIGFVPDFVGSVAPPVLAAAVLLTIFSRNGELAAAAPWTAAAAALGAVGAFVAFVELMGRRSPRWDRSLRRSQGALAGGVLVTAVIVAVALQQRAERLERNVSLAQYQLQDFALASMRASQDGAFLSANGPSERLTLHTEQATQQAATYLAAAVDVPGMLVAHLQRDSGTLYWQYGKENDLRVSFVAGRVIQTSPAGFTLEDPSGASRYLVVRDSTIPKPNVGTFVVAAVDPKTKRVNALREGGASR